jgi:hypothetical protein
VAEVTYQKDITCFVMIDPYNDFISEGGKVWDRLKGVVEAKSCGRFPSLCRSPASNTADGLEVDKARQRLRVGSKLRLELKNLGRERRPPRSPLPTCSKSMSASGDIGMSSPLLEFLLPVSTVAA